MYSETDNFLTPEALKKDYAKSPKKAWFHKWWGQLLLGFLVIFLSISIALAFYVGNLIYLLRSGQVLPQQLFGDAVTLSATTTAALMTLDDPSFGPRDAKVVIIEFADFQCPACYKAHDVVDQLKKDYSDKVLFIYRDFPLTKDHPMALQAAMAAGCAKDQGKFWEMHDMLFSDQANLSKDQIQNYASQLGIDNTEYKLCLDQVKYLKEVEQDYQDGITAGVQATPTFFINGRKIEGAIPLANLEQLIAQSISQK